MKLGLRTPGQILVMYVLNSTCVFACVGVGGGGVSRQERREQSRERTVCLSVQHQNLQMRFSQDS